MDAYPVSWNKNASNKLTVDLMQEYFHIIILSFSYFLSKSDLGDSLN